jgi:hypothetical protein
MTYPELFEIISQECIQRGFKEFKSQELSLLLWSFAKTNTKSLELFNNVVKECINRRLTEFKPQEISNLCWSLATMDLYNEEVFNMVSGECLKLELQEFNHQSIAMLIWSFGQFEIRDEVLFNLVAEECLRRHGMYGFTEQEFHMIIGAFANVRLFSQPLFQVVGDECVRRTLVDFSSYAITILVVSFGLFDFRHDGFFHEVAREVLRQGFMLFGNSHLGVLRWAFSKYPVQYPELIETIDVEAYVRDILQETVTFIPEARTLLNLERDQAVFEL